jgi:hypothetical protein
VRNETGYFACFALLSFILFISWDDELTIDLIDSHSWFLVFSEPSWHAKDDIDIYSEDSEYSRYENFRRSRASRIL